MSSDPRQHISQVGRPPIDRRQPGQQSSSPEESQSFSLVAHPGQHPAYAGAVASPLMIPSPPLRWLDQMSATNPSSSSSAPMGSQPPMPPWPAGSSPRAEAVHLQHCLPCGPFGQRQSSQIEGVATVKDATVAASISSPGADMLSRGSFGHPFNCSAPCKYVARLKGCRLQRQCLCCHLCKWTRKTDSLRGLEKLVADPEAYLELQNSGMCDPPRDQPQLQAMQQTTPAVLGTSIDDYAHLARPENEGDAWDGSC
jgi:hypothetical protein